MNNCLMETPWRCHQRCFEYQKRKKSQKKEKRFLMVLFIINICHLFQKIEKSLIINKYCSISTKISKALPSSINICSIQNYFFIFSFSTFVQVTTFFILTFQKIQKSNNLKQNQINNKQEKYDTNQNQIELFTNLKLIQIIQIRMNPELKESISQWPQWIQQFEFDPIYGYLINPKYHPVSFDYEILQQILSDLHNLNESGQIVEKIKQMPEIKINKQLATHKDMVILHDSCSYLIHSFVKILKDKEISEPDITLPKNLAMPLVQSASFLRVKTGMATGIGYNWKFKTQPQDLDKISIQNIQIKYFYSKQQEHESLFFQVSVVTSYFLSRIIKNCYQMNCIITQQPNLTDQVLKRMKNVKYFLKRIFQQNLNIQSKLDKQFFFYVLRVFVAGYQHIFFEGLNERVSSSGGAGGYDPSFQSFERAFGIYFQDQLGDIQKKLRNGMPEPHRNLIDFFAEYSLIRDYCQCLRQLQDAYNQTLQAYVKYLELHGTFIKNFIIHMMPINATRSSFGATGATMIKIVDRYRFVREQELDQKFD